MFRFLTPLNRPAPREGRRESLSIRLEAVGGQGANSAGKILAEAAVLGMGYSGNHFSSFGSEKRGTPVRSFVRISTLGHEVRNASSIRQPNLLVVFQESLINTNPELLEGLTDDSDVIINSTKSPKDISFPNGTKMRSLSVVDARAIMTKHGLLSSSLNAAMLGACSRVLPEITESVLEKYFFRYFQRLPESVQQQNLSVFQGAANAIRPIVPGAKQLNAKRASKLSELLPNIGYANAPIGGLIINPGNSVLKDNSASRKGTVPRLDRDLCFHCGYCDMVCPDYCFSWERAPDGTAKLKGIDYQYCKGCQKCVTACPVSALTPVPEDQISAADREIKLFSEAWTSESENS